MKTCFITGVAGFLGSHLADALIKDGWRVRGCDNMTGGYLDNIPKEVEFSHFDCLNRETMVKIMEGADVVVHAACTAYEGLSVFSPHLISQNTFGITTSVLSAALKNQVKRFVFCSSMARYGHQEVPFREEMTPNPQDPYGISKYASELMIRELCTTHGMEYVIAVPHNIIGPRQKYDDPFRNVASIMANKMLQGEQPYIYGDGEQMRCFSYIEDVIKPLTLMVTEDKAVGEVINIGPDEEFVSINILAKMLASIIGFDLKPKYVPDRPREVKLATCSSDKARRLLGYETTYTLNMGLEKIVEYIKARGPKPFTYHLPLEFVTDKIPKTWTQKLI